MPTTQALLAFTPQKKPNKISKKMMHKNEVKVCAKSELTKWKCRQNRNSRFCYFGGRKHEPVLLSDHSQSIGDSQF